MDAAQAEHSGADVWIQLQPGIHKAQQNQLGQLLKQTEHKLEHDSDAASGASSGICNAARTVSS